MAKTSIARITTDPDLAVVRKSLLKIDKRLTKELQKVNKESATEIAERARSEYARWYQPLSGKHQKGIKALATQTKAQVRLDSTARGAGGLLGQEFGGQAARFREWAGNGGEAGYFFYPSVRDELPAMMERYDERMGALLRVAFPD